jgi:hypothetical protein
MKTFEQVRKHEAFENEELPVVAVRLWICIPEVLSFHLGRTPVIQADVFRDFSQSLQGNRGIALVQECFLENNSQFIIHEELISSCYTAELLTSLCE